MKIVRGVGKLVKPFVNFPSWMGWKQISTTGSTIKDTAKDLLRTPKAKREETFAQAIERLHLTEADIQARMRTFKQLIIFYALIALGLFIYTIYLLIGSHVAAALLSFVLTFLALAFTFRQHFWYFQMKHRKLGCTIKEWFKGTLGGVK